MTMKKNRNKIIIIKKIKKIKIYIYKFLMAWMTP